MAIGLGMGRRRTHSLGKFIPSRSTFFLLPLLPSSSSRALILFLAHFLIWSFTAPQFLRLRSDLPLPSRFLHSPFILLQRRRTRLLLAQLNFLQPFPRTPPPYSSLPRPHPPHQKHIRMPSPQIQTSSVQGAAILIRLSTSAGGSRHDGRALLV